MPDPISGRLNSHLVTPSTSALFLSVTNSEVTLVTEEYSYDLASLVGEAGGALGLFLGVSVFSVVQLAVTAASTVGRRAKKRREV